MHERPPRLVTRRSVLTALLAAPFLAGATPVTPTTSPPATGTSPLPGRVRPPTITPLRSWAPSWVPAPTGLDRDLTSRLVVHHTFDPVAATPAEVPSALVRIADLHLRRGFDTFGYHYVVDPWGQLWQGRGALPDADGRAPMVQDEGAHVAGSNPGAIGVAFLGDHNAAPPTTAALAAATHLLAWLADSNDLDPHGGVRALSTGVGTALHTGEFDVEVIAGHRDSNATECPGHHLAVLLPALRDRVRHEMVTASRLGPIQPAPLPDDGDPLPTPTDDEQPAAAAGRELAQELRSSGLSSLAERLAGSPLG